MLMLSVFNIIEEEERRIEQLGRIVIVFFSNNIN